MKFPFSNLLMFFLGYSLFGSTSAVSVFGQVPDKAAPFTAVRWEGDEAVVQFEGDWYYLEALEQLSTAEIVGYCKDTYGRRWRKRFSEDLVEVLDGMGHQTKVQVTLRLRKGGTVVEKQAQMSEGNRKLVLQFNQGEDPVSKQSTSPQVGSNSSASTSNSYERMARQMGEQIDRDWDKQPQSGKANVRILMKKDGQPFAGVLSIQTEFGFVARNNRGTHHSQGLNPNTNGKWMYEGLDPGTYVLTIKGNGRFEDWSWSKNAVVLKAGDMPVFEIEL